MRDEIIEVSDLKELQGRAPFLFYLPGKHEIGEVTYRVQGRKWATLRFECVMGSEKLRVKEFFLDWFYPGFPKSLMDSFVSSYSALASTVKDGRLIFYGKNYKGKHSSSSYSLGTQIEIEGETEGNVRELSEALAAPYYRERFRNFPFCRRSFFANNGKPDWFEEKRISDLLWSVPSEKFCFGNLCLDSVGTLRNVDEAVETILVFSEDYYRSAMWVDIANPGALSENLIYNLRSGGNFFDVYEEGELTMAYRSGNGPLIARFGSGKSVVTISISPLIRLSDAKDIVGRVREMLPSAERFI